MEQNKNSTRAVNLLAVCLSLQLCFYKNNHILCSILGRLILTAGFSEKSILFLTLTECFSFFINLLAFLLPAAIFLYFRRDKKQKHLRLDSTLPLYPFFTILFSAALTSLILVCLDRITTIFPALPPIAIQIPEAPLPLLFFFLSIVIFPSIAGELFFHGIVLNELLPWGRTFAIFASAITGALFADTITHFIFYLIIGLITGYFVSHTDSLWIGIFISLTANTIYFLYSFIIAEKIARRWNSVFQILISIVFVLGIFSCIKIDDQIKNSKIRPLSPERKEESIRSCLFAPCALAYYIIVLIYI